MPPSHDVGDEAVVVHEGVLIEGGHARLSGALGLRQGGQRLGAQAAQMTAAGAASHKKSAEALRRASWRGASLPAIAPPGPASTLCTANSKR